MMIRQQDMTTNNDNIGDSKVSKKKSQSYVTVTNITCRSSIE